MPEMRTWESMRQQIRLQLERQTGHDVDAWNVKISRLDLADEAALRSWLGDQGLTGYPQTLLVWESFGYPDFLLADADDLVNNQYIDRINLRPIFDLIMVTISDFAGVSIQARKTYVSLVTPRRTFAVVQASTKKRLDLGLRLSSVNAPHGNLLAAKGVGNEAINVRIALESVDDLDDEGRRWLRQAYDESC